jgi:hypothetical protein
MLRVFQNRVLRISEPMREEVITKWRELFIKELHNLYLSQNTTRMMKLLLRCVGHVACMGE